MKHRGVVLFLCLCLAAGLLPGLATTAAAAYSDNWWEWSQGASSIGGKMNSSGCRIVSQAQMIAEMGIAPSGFNPDVYAYWVHANGFFGYEEDIKDNVGEKSNAPKAPVSYAATLGKTVTYHRQESLSSDTKENDKRIMDYLRAGYYVILGRDGGDQHHSYVLKNTSLQEGTTKFANSGEKNKNATNKLYVTDTGGFKYIRLYTLGNASPDAGTPTAPSVWVGSQHVVSPNTAYALKGTEIRFEFSETNTSSYFYIFDGAAKVHYEGEITGKTSLPYTFYTPGFYSCCIGNGSGHESGYVGIMVIDDSEPFPVSTSTEGTHVYVSWANIGAASYYVYIFNTETQQVVSNTGINVGASLSANYELSKGSYVAYVTAVYSSDVMQTGSTPFSINPYQATTNKGPEATFNKNENTVLTVDATKYDYCLLQIYHTPVNGDTYLYWEGSIPSNQTTKSFSESGYYSCFFRVYHNGASSDSLWVGWLVSAPVYLISANAIPTEGGAVNGSDSYEEGSSVTVTATPASGYRFLRWTENDTQVSTNASYTFPATANRTLVAVFEAIPATPVYSIDVSTTQGGTVSGGGSYDEGSSVTVTATPTSGYHFLRWTENGTQVSATASYTFTATANRTIVAVFEAIPAAPVYAIDVSTTQGGTVSGGGSYDEGSSVTVTAAPASGYRFLRWTENGATVSTNASYTFTASANRTLVAVFELIPTPSTTLQLVDPTLSGNSLTAKIVTGTPRTATAIVAFYGDGGKMLTAWTKGSCSLTNGGTLTLSGTVPQGWKSWKIFLVEESTYKPILTQ